MVVGVSVLCLLLAACGSNSGSEQAADSSGPSTDASIGIDMLVANANLKRGQNLFLQCRACHSLEEGGLNKVGPNLYGMFGSKAAFATGFAYSDALTNSDVVWTPDTVDQWLARPSQFLPGNRMVFVGIRDPQDRANIIAFLRQETGATAN
jgi:cytochrome c